MIKTQRQFIEWVKTGKNLQLLRNYNVNLRREVCRLKYLDDDECRGDGDCDNCRFEMDSNISRLIVRNDFRGEGYGKQIIFWAETEALKADIYQVYVHSLINKVNFYKKLGYQSVGEQFMEDGREHIKMTKILSLD